MEDGVDDSFCQFVDHPDAVSLSTIDRSSISIPSVR
jgi:hypothetical protein